MLDNIVTMVTILRSMMFLLKDLPNKEILKTFSEKYSEMQIDNVEACLHLLKTASELLREFERHFSEHGLSQARFLTLIVLEREDSKQLLPVEIAEKMGISKPNITRLLLSLEEDKLVKRAAHATDKRASIITITPKGSKILVSVMPGYYQIMNKAMKPIDNQSKKKFIETLELVNLDFSN